MGPDVLLYTVMGLAVVLYAVLGGADFGAGVWQFNLAFRMPPDEQRFCDRAMGPIWETNHVWLIFVIVVLFSAFPPAFAALSRALWLPFLLALVGIVFRGCGFAFRHYATGAEDVQRRWSIVFALSSTFTPFFLGASVGAVASGQLRVASDGSFTGSYFTDWISFLSIYTGFFSVGVCAYLAAVFLTRDAAREGNPHWVTTWRRRALGMGVTVGILAITGLMVVAVDAPMLWDELSGRATPLVVLSVLAGGYSLLALYRHWYNGAVLGASVTVAAVIGGWALGQYPILVPPAILVPQAAAPDNVLWLFILTAALGSVVLIPSLGLLFWVFKAQPIDRAASDGCEFRGSPPPPFA